jgi:PTH1 family peptidyl-tRNA hydrolase
MVEGVAIACGGAGFRRTPAFVEISQFYLNNERVLLAKPQTFMNLSGKAVRFLVDFYKIPLERVYVFHDDIDLQFGRLKMKNGGGNGGHNGLKNIDEFVGTDYWRLRVGIGRPEEKFHVSSYVLSDFSPDEEVILMDMVEAICQNLPLLFTDIRQFSSKVSKKI